MAELKGSKTEQNLRQAFAGESQARNKYTYFAGAGSLEARTVGQRGQAWEIPSSYQSPMRRPWAAVFAMAEDAARAAENRRLASI